MIYVYIVAGLLVAAVGGAADHFILERPHYDELQSQFDGYKSQQAGLVAQQQQAYAAGLAKQLKDFQTTTANNQQVIKGLQDERDSAASDRDFARKLLNAARAAAATANTAPGKGPAGGPGTAGVPKDNGDGSLVGLIGGATGECRDAMQRLAALQDEVIPQLKVTQ